MDKPWKPEAFQPADESAERRDAAWLDAQEEPDALVEAEDDFADDAFLEQYRQVPCCGLWPLPAAGLSCLQTKSTTT